MLPQLLEKLSVGDLFFFLGGAALAAFQYLIKKWINSLEDDLKSLHTTQKEINTELSHIKENYVVKADMREFRQDLMSRLDRIENHILEAKRNV